MKKVYLPIICMSLYTFSILALFLPNSVLLLKLLLGVFGLLFMPGLLLTSLLFKQLNIVERFGLALLFGFLVQEVNVLLLYNIVSLYYATINFSMWIYSLTFLWIIALMFLCIKGRFTSKQYYFVIHLGNVTLDKVLLLLSFIIALTVRLWYQSFSPSPYTDGALYLDFARNIAYGTFKTNVVLPQAELLFTRGFVGHAGVSFIMSIFFMFSETSYFVGKIAAVLAGALIVFPIYGLAKELFDEKAGMIAAFFSALHPLPLLYSSFLFGPENLAALFIITSLYLLVLSVKQSNFKYSFISAIFAYLAFITWNADFYVFLAYIPFLYILLDEHAKNKFQRLFTFIFCIYFIVTIRLTGHPLAGVLWYVGVPLVILLHSWIEKQKKNALYVTSFFATLFLIVNFGLIRSFHYPEAYIVPTSKVSVSQMFLQYMDIFVEKIWISLDVFHGWWKLYLTAVSPAITFSAFLSLLKNEKYREKILLLIYPVLQLVFYVFLIPESFVQELYTDRTLVAISFSLIVLSAVTAKYVMPDLKRNIKVSFSVGRKNFTAKNIKSIMIVSIISISFIANFYPQWSANIDLVKNADLKAKNKWGSAIEWVVNNTNPNDALMARKTYEWAWYTGRLTINPGPASLNSTELYDVIGNYKVNYLIVDREFYVTYKDLRTLYTNPVMPPIGFEVVYQSSPSDTTRVIVYNVTKIAYGRLITSYENITNCDSLSEWVVWYDSRNKIFRGNLTIDTQNCREGLGAVKVESTYLPLDDVYIAKFENRPASLIDVSSANDIIFWFKANTTINGKMYFQFFDAKEGYRIWVIPYENINTWTEISISLHTYEMESSTPLDLSQIKIIVFWFTAPDSPFTVWIDEISIKKMVLLPENKTS